MSEKNFQKTLIIGLGLIGGSFAKALRQHKISERIYAYDLNPESLEAAIKSKIIDDFVMLDEDLSDFDFIVFATPLSTYEKIAKEIVKKISSNIVIIDLGSIKQINLKKLFKSNFIPCHPIAGSEKVGFENSDAQLFSEKKFIICPENCDEKSLKKVSELVKIIGAIPEFLEAKKHDEIYALVSHLPQFLSFLTKDFSPKKISNDFFKTAFRLDNSDAEMWSDIFKLNEKNLEKFYFEFFDNLEENIKSLPSFEWRRSEKMPNNLADLESNFAAIFFRALVVKSYLEISQIANFQNYAGTGFRDFTSIVAVLNYDPQILQKLIEKNRSQILKFFNSLS